MFRAVLFGDESIETQALAQLARETDVVELAATLPLKEGAYDLLRIFNNYEPELLFLHLNRTDAAWHLAEKLREAFPDVPIVGFGSRLQRGEAERCREMEIVTVLTTPMTAAEFINSVSMAIDARRTGIQPKLWALLPAKAGSGCSTAAATVASALVSRLRKRTLLIEADLNSGILGTLLNIEGPHGLREALADSSKLSEFLWTQFVTPIAGIDMLLASRVREGPLPSWGEYFHLLDFARPKYDHILVDLPEVVNAATVEVIRRAERVFIVTTQELPALELARRRSAELVERGGDISRVGVIVTRWHRGELKIADVEQILKRTVDAIFPNNYDAVRRAHACSRLVDLSTSLGTAAAEFASCLEQQQFGGKKPSSRLDQLRTRLLGVVGAAD